MGRQWPCASAARTGEPPDREQFLGPRGVGRTLGTGQGTAKLTPVWLVASNFLCVDGRVGRRGLRSEHVLYLRLTVAGSRGILIRMQPSQHPDRRFAPHKTGDATPLGQLESAVMSLVWSHGGAISVGDIHAALPEQQRVAYTTVKTTMERLAEKGILSQARAGKAYLYRAAISQEDLERRTVPKALDRRVAQFPDAIASFFVRPEPGVSGEQLALLEEAIRRRRESADG